MDYKYQAFISYCHIEPDKIIAKKLHSDIEHFTVPKRLRKKENVKRIGKAYLDREEYTVTGDLEQSIQDALKTSKFLIVVCSPRAAASKWVDREIKHFKNIRSQDRILPILIDGQPLTSFPSALFSNGNEPLAADIRSPNIKESLRLLKTEKLRLLAPLLDCSYDDLKRRSEERQKKRWYAILSIFFLVIVFFGILSGLFFHQKTLAEEATLVTRRQLAFRFLNEGNIAGGVALMAKVLDSEGIESQNDRLIIDYWLPRLTPISQLIANRGSHTIITWEGKNYYYSKYTGLNHLNDKWMDCFAISKDKKTLITVENGIELVFRRIPHSEVVLKVPLEESYDSCSIYEIKPETFMYSAYTQSSYAGGSEPRFLVVDVRMKKTQLLKPSQQANFYPDCSHLVIDNIFDEEVPETERKKIYIVDLYFDSKGMLDKRPIYGYVSDFKLKTDACPTIGEAWRFVDPEDPNYIEEFQFPNLKPEKEMWQLVETSDIKYLNQQSTIEYRILSGIGEQSFPKNEQDEGNQVYNDDQNFNDTLKVKDLHSGEVKLLQPQCPVSTPENPSWCFGVSADNRGSWVVEREGSIFLVQLLSGVDRFGTHFIYQIENNRIKDYSFISLAGDDAAGLIGISQDKRYLFFSEFKYMGDESLSILDLASLDFIKLSETPRGLGPGEPGISYNDKLRELAIISESGELWLYKNNLRSFDLLRKQQLPHELRTLTRFAGLSDLDAEYVESGNEIVEPADETNFYSAGNGQGSESQVERPSDDADTTSLESAVIKITLLKGMTLFAKTDGKLYGLDNERGSIIWMTKEALGTGANSLVGMKASNNGNEFAVYDRCRIRLYNALTGVPLSDVLNLCSEKQTINKVSFLADGRVLVRSGKKLWIRQGPTKTTKEILESFQDYTGISQIDGVTKHSDLRSLFHR